MKKIYIEPELRAEDFTVSEMIAANCEIVESDITVVQYMSHTGCKADYGDWEVTDAYARFSDMYDGSKDLDFNGTNDFCFTKAYANKSPGENICSFQPFEEGIFFGHGVWDCSGDSSLVQNS